ncbi:NUDIX domain-containing protein [Pseudaeromonas sp. ZJS20]|uniref:NUDIX hydrolase n=1 Tax=Pseudaeromonas aegiceratis TaxID=3153928 RepID=UPI00390CBC96
MSHIDKLALLQVQDNRLLMVRSQGKTLFYLPGGKREAGESDTQALCREIAEELAVTLEPDSLQHQVTLSAQADGKPAGTLVRLTCYAGHYAGTPQPAAEIAELAWLGLADRARCSAAALLVLDWLAQQGLLR